MYFRAFNFRTSQAVRKYFNNKIFAIYGNRKFKTHNVHVPNDDLCQKLKIILPNYMYVE